MLFIDVNSHCQDEAVAHNHGYDTSYAGSSYSIVG